MFTPHGPSRKGIWTRQRHPKRLHPHARSSYRIKLRQKGLSPYPSSKNLT